MAVSEMKKFGIVTTKEKKQELIKLLQRFGDVELIEPEKSEEKLSRCAASCNIS